MKKMYFISLLLLIILILQGCGETVRGVGRDVSRVGRGVKTIFVSDST